MFINRHVVHNLLKLQEGKLLKASLKSSINSGKVHVASGKQQQTKAEILLLNSSFPYSLVWFGALCTLFLPILTYCFFPLFWRLINHLLLNLFFGGISWDSPLPPYTPHIHPISTVALHQDMSLPWFYLFIIFTILY